MLSGADYKREFHAMRERAVASFAEWQSFVEDWKGSLLTRREALEQHFEPRSKSKLLGVQQGPLCRQIHCSCGQ